MDKGTFEWTRAFWGHYQETIFELEDDEAGKVLKAIIQYFDNGSEPDFKDRVMQIAFKSMKKDIDSSLAQSQYNSNTNRENANKRWEKEQERQSQLKSQWGLKHN